MKRKADWKRAYRAVMKVWRALSEHHPVQARSPETRYPALKCEVAGCEDASDVYVKRFHFCKEHYENFLHDNPEQAKAIQKWVTSERYGVQSGRKRVDKVDLNDLRIDVDIILKSAMRKGYRTGTEDFRRYAGQRFIRSGVYNLTKKRRG